MLHRLFRNRRKVCKNHLRIRKFSVFFYKLMFVSVFGLNDQKYFIIIDSLKTKKPLFLCFFICIVMEKVYLKIWQTLFA